MPGTPTDESLPRSDDARIEDTPTANARYAAFEVADGGLVIYDAEDNRAWLRTDAPVALAERA